MNSDDVKVARRISVAVNDSVGNDDSEEISSLNRYSIAAQGQLIGRRE